MRRLMKQECPVAATSMRRRYGLYLGEISPTPDNLLNRDFSADAPNEKWLTDITEFHIPAGKVYLSPMIDCFDGAVVSWSIGTRPNPELVNTMLDAAIDKFATNGSKRFASKLPVGPNSHARCAPSAGIPNPRISLSSGAGLRARSGPGNRSATSG